MKKTSFTFFAIIAVGLLNIVNNSYAARVEYTDQAVLIPYVEFSSEQVTTVVGLTVADPGTIYWAFFDSDGTRRASGIKTAVDLQKISFVWASEAPAGALLADEPGFLVFAIDTNNSGTITSADRDALKASAFFVDQPNNDVAYIPVIDIDDSQLSSSNPGNWSLNPVAVLPSANSGEVMDLPYLIEGSPNDGDDTRLYLFTTRDPGSTQAMRINDGDGNSIPLSVFTNNNNLNIIDPELISNLPQQYYGDGFLLWQVPQGTGGETLYAFVFSIVKSNFFGAAQTLLGGY